MTFALGLLAGWWFSGLLAGLRQVLISEITEAKYPDGLPPLDALVEVLTVHLPGFALSAFAGPWAEWAFCWYVKLDSFVEKPDEPSE